MKFIKYFFLFIVVVFGVVVMVGLNLSDNLYLEKSISLTGTSANQVYDMIHDMENWVHWFPHLKDDTSAKIVLYDDLHKPSMCQWDGNKFSGTAKITESHQNQYLKIQFHSKEFGLVHSDFRIIQKPYSTSVIWGCRIPVEQDPLQKIVSHAVYKEIFLSCMNEGLQSLKIYLAQEV